MVRAALQVSLAALLLSIGAGCSCASTPPRDGGATDSARPDASALDGGVRMDAGADAGEDAGAPLDAQAADVGIDAGQDASTSDAGCSGGETRACTVRCMGGATAPGRERCLGAGVWGACERPTELCGNGVDDDGDGSIDEDCRVEGGCVWIRPACQGVLTLNDWCTAAGGMHLVAGRRCAVAGGAVVPLDTAYGAYPLCCCDAVSMCVPECTMPSCMSCVVWDEIQCCP